MKTFWPRAAFLLTAALTLSLSSCPDGGGSPELRSSDATLKNLTVSRGTLYPPFDPRTAAYTVTVAHAVETITLEAEPNHAGALIAGDGNHTLSVGSNPLAVTVTAEDGSAGTYAVTVTRSPPYDDPGRPPDTGGLEWTTAAQQIFTPENGKTVYALAWGAGKWIAAGTGGTMAWSADGLTWTPVADSSFGASNIRAIAWNGSRFVAAGNNGKLAHSTDGLTWTGIPSGTGPGTSQLGTAGFLAIAWNGSRFVAVGGSGTMAHSTDGLIWTAIPGGTGVGASQLTGVIWSIAWGNGKWLAGGGNGQIASSPDGLTWTSVAFEDTYNGAILSGSRYFTNIFGIAWGANLFVAVDRMGRMASSPDGLTWTPITSPFSSSIFPNGVAWGGNQFIAVGGGAMSSSPDGRTWTLATGSAAAAAELQVVAWGNGKFVVAGKSFLACSNVQE
jgi:hypothetical protein